VLVSIKRLPLHGAFGTATPFVHCKKSWRKTPPGWPDVTDSLVRGTEHFFNMQIKLIRRTPMMMTEYFEISGIFLQIIWRVLTMMTEYFEISGNFLRFPVPMRKSFQQFSVNFPAEKRNQNHNQHQRDSNLRPSGLQPTTLPLRHTHFLSVNVC
jgi:hypothetical protein